MNALLINGSTLIFFNLLSQFQFLELLSKSREITVNAERDYMSLTH